MVVVVTGGGSGIGRACAEWYAARGHHVVIAGRRIQSLEKVAKEIGRSVLPIACDVSDEGHVHALVERVRRDRGRADILINNAGVAPLAPIMEMSIAEFDELTKINMRGVFLTTRAFWPLLMESAGVIVNISSRSARDPFPGFAAYGGSKAFVELFTRGIAAEGAPVGIRCYGVAPAGVNTPLLRSLFPDYPADKLLTPQQVAEAVAWVADSDCRLAPGHTIEISQD